MKQGTITLTASAVIKNLKPESLAADPSGLTEKATARIWFNTKEKKLKFFDGVAIHVLAVGGNLEDYLRTDGTVAMEADLMLSSADQSASDVKAAVSKGYMVAELAKKQDVVTGAATTVLTENLAAEVVTVTDASGKLAASTVTTAELGYLTGVTENIVTSLGNKQDTIGYVPVDANGTVAMTANLSMGGFKATGLAKGTEANDAVTLAQLENAVAGLDFQKDVNGVQVDATLDVTDAVKGARYILTDVTKLHASFGSITGVANNDIVEFNGEAWELAYDVSVMGEGALVWNMANGEYLRFDTTWDKFGGLSGVTAGLGLSKEGDVINVNLGGGIVAKEDTLVVATYAGGALQLVNPDDGTVSTDPNAVLAVKFDGASLEATVNGIKVKANGITKVMINADVVGNGLQGGEGTALAVKAADESITVDATGVKVNEAHTDTIYARQDGATFTAPIVVVNAVEDNQAMPKAQVLASIAELAGNTVDELSTRYEDSYFEFNSNGTPALTFTVVHNIGTKAVQVVCYDEMDDQFIPNSVTCTDENTVTVTVADAMDVRIVVQGLKAKAVTPPAPAE